MGPNGNAIARGAFGSGANVVAMMVRENDGREPHSERLLRIQDVEQTTLFLGLLRSRVDEIRGVAADEVGIGVGAGRQGGGFKWEQLHVGGEEDRRQRA